MPNKDNKDLIREIRRQGFKLVRRRRIGTHYAIYAQDGTFISGISLGGGDRAARDNVVARLRRHGFVYGSQKAKPKAKRPNDE